jgi:hypothetical protein
LDIPTVEDIVTYNTSDNFDAYLPVYDTIPESWDESRPVLVEQLKRIGNAVNIRSIGWYLNEQLLSGKQFFPGTANNQTFRSIFRTVVDFSPVTTGLNTKPHGVTIDSSFRLINLYGAVTDNIAFTGHPINEPNITYDATNIYLTSDADFEFGQAVFEYILEA